jgi:hypothetical protein
MSKRLIYGVLFLATIALGLLSRMDFIPKFIYPYLGDALYSVMIFWLLSFINPNAAVKRRFIAALVICFSIEFLQMYQANWIVEIRGSRLGALILGSGFLWSDIVSYTIGAMLAYLTDSYLKSRVFKV